MTRKSAQSASSRPPPSAYPVIAAITGFGIRATALKASWMPTDNSMTRALLALAISLTSAPAAKIFSPP